MKRLIVALAALLGTTVSKPLAAQEIEHYLPSEARGNQWQPRLLLREQQPADGDRSRPVLYVHGATFPSALSIMFKLEGNSWADNLNASGFDVFGLDFAGYGGSDRYPEMPPCGSGSSWTPGRADEAARQIERAARFVLKLTGAPKLAIVAHSWGTIPAGLFAGLHPELVEKVVLFGPIAQREEQGAGEIPPFRLITPKAQHDRFVASVPAGEPGVLIEDDFPRWSEAYLDSDPSSRGRNPISVKAPAGPEADIAEAWGGNLPYDPALVKAPILIIRGAWDPITTDADAAWLRGALTASAHVEDVIVPRGTHLMHLERGRVALYAAVTAFLNGRTHSSSAEIARRDPTLASE